VLLFRTQRELVRARLAWRAGLTAATVGMLCAIAFNDGGVIAATFIAMFGCLALIAELLEPAAPEPAPEFELAAFASPN
jgi:hypothetical protein